jgi:cytochrome P450
MMAGADTTAITLRAVIYYCLKQPKIIRKLQQELDAARLTLPISYKSAQSLPYLNAVIREACRMHPGVGLPLERIVPDEGLKLPDGRFIPAGTIVGMNAWVVHGDQNVFGPDADCFRPERWLQEEGETDAEYEARKKAMKDADLTFGAGNRICLGKNISLLEIYKVVATLFLLYDITLVDPKKDWEVQNSWFVRQSGIDVNLKRRSRVF